MSLLSRLLTDANALVFMLLAVASIREYRRGHGRAGAWAATAFVTLGLLASLAFIPVQPAHSPVYHAFWYQLLVRIILGVLVAFPYLLFRLAATFHEPSRLVRRTLGGLTGGIIALGFVLPRFPAPDEPRPLWVVLYLMGIVVQWTATSVFAAAWLWRRSSGRPTAARYRMRLLAAGVASLNFLILLSASAPASDPQHPNHLLQLVDLAVGLVFFIGLAPPHFLIQRL